MGRNKKIDHGRRITFYIPTSVNQKVREQLYSEEQKRVPFGALSELGEELFKNWLKKIKKQQKMKGVNRGSI